MRYWRGALIFSVAAIALLAGLARDGLWASSAPGERLAGPIGAQVLRVLDGDTIEVSARIWLGQNVETRVRLAGIDAPELRGACSYERELAARARAHLVARLGSVETRAARVTLYDISLGKYAGRVLARVQTAAGEDLSQSLLAAGLARPYRGGGRDPWCAAAG